jgi:hypothetical protein
LDCTAKHSKIKGIHAGSDPKKIIIIIDTTIETDRVIEWSMENQSEINSFNVGKQYDIFFDS